MKYLFVVACACLFFIGCSNDKTAMPAPKVLIEDTVISFSKDIVPILQVYCYGTGGQQCHVTNSNQGSNGDFTTCAGLIDKVNNGSLQSRVFSPSGGMPPSYSLGPTQIADTALQKLELWVNQGANCN
ncbi:MAG: hypothetical protein H0W62_01155 [Chitinophagales bacterium]|nr:hypothetical protein [Chitinophagales bacterium]